MGQALVIFWRSRKQEVWIFVVGAGFVGVECPSVYVDNVVVLVLVAKIIMSVLQHGDTTSLKQLQTC
jgi:hypothetical protein